MAFRVGWSLTLNKNIIAGRQAGRSFDGPDLAHFSGRSIHVRIFTGGIGDYLFGGSNRLTMALVKAFVRHLVWMITYAMLCLRIFM